MGKTRLIPYLVELLYDDGTCGTTVWDEHKYGRPNKTKLTQWIGDNQKWASAGRTIIAACAFSQRTGKILATNGR